jgi:DNA replication protein DnaC
MSQENSPISSTTDLDFTNPCRVCGGEPLCGGIGMLRYDAPMDDPNFGKMYRCPNNPPQRDESWQERLREISNLSAFAEKTFEAFETKLAMHTPAEQASLILAYETALDFAQNPVGWLLLEGEYGCGKTHLAAAIGNARLIQGDNALFITTPDLLDHLRSSFGPSSEVGYDETFDRVRNSPILILDDLGVENPSHWAQEKLFQLMNYRYVNRLPTIITTNADIDRLDDRIRSRLLDVTLIRRVKITAPDYRSLVQNERDQLRSNLANYADMTFESFDIYTNAYPKEQKNLEKVVQAAYSYAQKPEGWLLLMGGFGTGKTHLAAAIAQYREQMNEEVMFITAPDLLDYLRYTYDPTANASFDQRFQAVKNVPILILDDLGVENATAWAKEKLFQLLDYRYVTRKPTVITTARDIEKIDDRMRSRLLDDRRCAMFAITSESYVIRRKRK